MRAPGGFAFLWRAFFAQFFSTDSARADVQMRHTIAGIFAFLIVPGIVLVVELFFDYQGIVARAIHSGDFSLVDDTLEWVAFIFVTYAMVTVGVVAVFVWEWLAFDRRDAIVLGPLPLRGSTIVAAKLFALAVFLVGATAAVNVPNAFVFSFATANSLSAGSLVRHFAALLGSTTMAASFVFTSLVVLRGTLALVAGPRLAAACGAVLQFLFVVAVLCFVILCPAIWSLPHRALVNPETTGWLPTSWFLGVFERIRGSSRPYFMPLGVRGFVAAPAMLAAAVIVSIAAYRRQMQAALAPPALVGAAGSVRTLRWLARQLARSHAGAGATIDFVLLTLARSRPQQTLVAMNAAIGVAVAFGSLVQLRTFSPAGHPASAVLAIPLVLTYWIGIGLRAAFFVPSELPAAWTFRLNGPGSAKGEWAAVRAVLLAALVPCAVFLAAPLTPLIGVRAALLEASTAATYAALLAECLALTFAHVPFTRTYPPGHARLRTRWPLYLLGMYVFAFWPAGTMAVAIAGDPMSMVLMVVPALGAVAALELRGALQRPRAPHDAGDEEPDEVFRVTVLDIRAAR